MRILFSGSRSMKDPRPIYDELGEFLDGSLPPDLTFVHGDAFGCDKLVSLIAREYYPHAVVEPHRADWNGLGKAAGPQRNQEMVNLGADVLLAFPSVDSVGTIDCIKRAIRAWIPVRTRTIRT